MIKREERGGGKEIVREGKHAHIITVWNSRIKYSYKQLKKHGATIITILEKVEQQLKKKNTCHHEYCLLPR